MSEGGALGPGTYASGRREPGDQLAGRLEADTRAILVAIEMARSNRNTTTNGESMRQQNAEGIWVGAWEMERENGELAFLSKTQIGYLEFLDENFSPASECWYYMLKAQRELAEAEASLAKGWGRPQALKGRIRAAQKLIGLIQKRVVAAIQRLELHDVAEVLSSDCEQDYKLLVLERLSELAAPAE